jgi:hypothetical protein
MKLHISVLTLIFASMSGGAPLLAAEDASMGKDLKATIALQGMPCDAVTQAKHNGDSDYTVSCKDGNRYHVFVNSQGRVIVQKI